MLLILLNLFLCDVSEGVWYESFSMLTKEFMYL